jgi:tripartite-type tricarboxylate transporter receptor subunit TctC
MAEASMAKADKYADALRRGGTAAWQRTAVRATPAQGPWTRRDFIGGALAGLAAALPMSSHAAEPAAGWPQKPIDLVIPFAPGGPVDIAGRTVGVPLGQALRQTIVVVNKAGAGGNIAAAATARAPADGYEFMLALDSILTVNPAFYKDAGFKPQTDLSPVAQLGDLASVLVVNENAGIATVDEFIKRARSQPLTFGSGGNGTAGHLYGEWLKYDFGLKVEHVPYKGLAPAVQGLLAGDIDFIVALIPGVLPQIRSGRLRALGLTSTGRQTLLPDAKPLSSLGLAGFEGSSWLGVVGPRGLPADVVARFAVALRTSLDDLATAERLRGLGIEPAFADAAALQSRIERESRMWARLLAKMNASAS